MPWTLGIQTKSAGVHTLIFDDKGKAEAALERAKKALEEGSETLATIEGQLVVPRADVAAMTIYETGY